MGYRPSCKPRRHTMLVEAQVTINGSQAAVWAAITNIENAANIISGIEHIEVVEKPANGLVGLKLNRNDRLRSNDGKERNHEIAAHLGRHQKHQYP
jgi:hypothetical protein